MDFFTTKEFFLLYKNHLNRSIIKENGLPIAVRKDTWPSLVEIAPSGTWTSLNLNQQLSLHSIKNNLKSSSRVIFTNIDNVINEQILLEHNIKFYTKETWFESDLMLTEPSLDTIFCNFKSSVRRNIKKSMKDSKITFIQDNNRIDDFLLLHNVHAEQKGFTPYSKGFIIDLLTQKAKLFFIEYDEKVVGAHIMLFDTTTAFQYIHSLCGDAYKLRVDDFFRYKLIEYAYNSNYTVMKFGGTPENLKSLREFKEGFRSISKEYSIYTFYSSYIIEKLCNIKSKFRN